MTTELALQEKVKDAHEVIDLANKPVRRKRYTNVNVVREGVNITIPEHMDTEEAIKWLKVQRDAENREVTFHREFDAYPLDGARAVKLALEQIYGYADVRGQASLFGETPPRWVELDMGNGEKVQIPWGVLWPQGLEGFMKMSYKHEPDMKFVLNGSCKAKDEGAFAAICDVVQAILKVDSLYRGRAFRLSFDWENLKDKDGNIKQPDPLDLAPKMLDVRGLDRDTLILNEETRFQLETSVLLRLEATQACLEANVPLKNGVLLTGPYGTGKTLTARVIANIATRNNWTFIYLDDVAQFPRAIRLAEMYGPAIVFGEDIDEILDGERDEYLNKILNTIDGIDTKRSPIMTVLTTNHPEKIQKGFLRAGRIDTLVDFGAPDQDTAWKFVELYTQNTLGQTMVGPIMPEQRQQICTLLSGMMPAFIAEVCKKAVLRAMYRKGRAPGVGDINAHDLLLSAKAMIKHVRLADEFGLYPQQED